MVDRVPFVEAALRAGVRAIGERYATVTLRGAAETLRGDGLLTCGEALALYRTQLESRHLDLRARTLKKTGRSFYTIGSSGHEGNAAVAAALRVTDPAFLHYRSCAFFLERARQAKKTNAALDVLLGVVASSDEPIAGGRHKVLGSRALAIPPQTSTIASHLPKAVGMAFGLGRAKRVGVELEVPSDAVVVASFGDASLNHSTAQGALNAASWAAFQGQSVPVLFVCEDNGLGISVPTPRGWVRAAMKRRPELHYVAASGLDLARAYDAAVDAVSYVRRERKPAFLHLGMVRLFGHAGSDVETGYRTLDEIDATEALDPLLVGAELLVSLGAATADELLGAYDETEARIASLAEEAMRRPVLRTAKDVIAPLAPRDDEVIAAEALCIPSEEARSRYWAGKLPEAQRPLPLQGHINAALGDLFVKYPELFLFGEDVAKKGGVYGVTRDLQRMSGRGRVFDTLLDEQTILGLALGFGQLGLLPIPEIQYLAYLHNAEDQLRGEAASLQFFSNGQFKNPMVVRIAGYAYQKGFGGHFHNDNSVAVLRDIPGIVIASPSRGDDAAAMLRTCVAAAKTCGSVCVFLEPIALYGERDLHEKGDGLLASAYAPTGSFVAIGEGRAYGDGRELLLVSYANGVNMCLRAQKKLREEHGIDARVFDLRWLAPLPTKELARQASEVGAVLVVDETRRSGGVSEALFTALVEGGYRGPLVRLAAEDTFIPLGDAANLVLVQDADVLEAALSLVRG